MTKLLTPSGDFSLVIFEKESEFENIIVKNAKSIFGQDTIYLDVKKRIGKTKPIQTIPDGFLIDISAPNAPKLFVIENEIVSHDPFRHIGIQLLSFATSFGQGSQAIKNILYKGITEDKNHNDLIERYIDRSDFRNLDNLLDYLVYEYPFSAIVVIDKASEQLHHVLKYIEAPVEVIEVATYENSKSERIYRYQPFQEDVREGLGKLSKIDEVDTIVCPAREDGFKEVFLASGRWWAIRINSTMIPQLKYIAMYRVSPISAITHYGKIASIKPYRDSGKYIVELDGKPKKISPVKLSTKEKGKAPQAPRYTTIKLLRKAKTLRDIFG